MHSKTAKISSEDIELFRSHIKGAKPIKHDKVTFKPQQPKHREKFQKKTIEEVSIFADDFPEVTAEEVLFFARPGLQTKLIRKLRRGQFPIEASLDLHRLTLAEAKQALTAFLGKCLTQKMRHICVIHGKGSHSAGQKATLKSAVNSWLRQNSDILAFCSARPIDGGAGAIYVLLKRAREI